MINSSRRHSDSKYVDAQERNHNTREAKTNGTERRNGQTHNYSGNFNTSLSKIDKATRQKVSKDIKELTINQQDLTDIYTHSSQ